MQKEKLRIVNDELLNQSTPSKLFNLIFEILSVFIQIHKTRANIADKISLLALSDDIIE